MAAKVYHASLGAGLATDVTSSAASTGADIELTIANTSQTGMSKMQILRALKAFEYAVTQDNTLPKE
jgi:hypothetical protein